MPCPLGRGDDTVSVIDDLPLRERDVPPTPHHSTAGGQACSHAGLAELDAQLHRSTPFPRPDSGDDCAAQSDIEEGGDQPAVRDTTAVRELLPEIQGDLRTAIRRTDPIDPEQTIERGDAIARNFEHLLIGP